MSEYFLTSGAEMIAEAATDAGINFFAGYPITPASSVFSAMINRLQAQGKVALGVSDEISAVSMCIGASIRGAKPMTATAAPGLSLMIENIGYAFATETPLLIVLGQRLGPSTGAATQSAEGDISFVQSMISGGFTIPVLAPNSILNCYETTFRAVNLAEELRTPVILLSQKDIIMSTVNIELAKFLALKKSQKIIERKYFNYSEDKVFKTYDFNQLAEVPEFVAAGVGGSDRVVVTGSTHDKLGRLSKTSPEAMEVFKHLRAKIEDNIESYNYHEFNKSPENNSAKLITIISFLQSDLSAREAVLKARTKGLRVNHLTLFTLFPIPEKLIRDCIKGSDLIVIPEINISGQYAEAIKHLFYDENGKMIKLKKINSIANLISPETILEAIEQA